MLLDRMRSEHKNLTEFPVQGTPAQQFHYLLQYAVLAPSRYNAQPWLWEIEGNTLRLYPDYHRELPAVDFNGRETLIGCGAALFYLRLAIRHAGFTDEVDVLPNPNDPDLLATIRLGTARAETADERSLFCAIPLRHTNRQQFADQPVPRSLLHDLQAAANAENAWLHSVQQPTERTTVAALIAEADQQHWADADFRREYADWHHGISSEDGLRSDPLGVRSLIIRTFDIGQRQAEHHRQLAENAPLLVVLGTPNDTPRDWLYAGEALARVLLRAQIDDYAASFLNQPIERQVLRRHLGALIGRAGFPQIMLRMGIGPAVSTTPRRPLADVVL